MKLCGVFQREKLAFNETDICTQYIYTPSINCSDT